MKNRDCKFWTFVKDNRQCWLKSKKTITSYGKSNLISGPRACTGIFYHIHDQHSYLNGSFTCFLDIPSTCFEDEVNYDGNNVDNVRTETFEKCKEECAMNPLCKFWSFVKDSKQCWLKSKKVTISFGKSNVMSGPKLCLGNFKIKFFPPFTYV